MDLAFQGRVRLATALVVPVVGRATIECVGVRHASLARRRYRVDLPLASIGVVSVEMEAADFVDAAHATYATGERRAPAMRHAVRAPPTVQHPKSMAGAPDFHRAHVCHLDQAIVFTTACGHTRVVVLLAPRFFQAMFEAGSNLLSATDAVLLLPPLTHDWRERHLRGMHADRTANEPAGQPTQVQELALLRYNALVCYGVPTEHTKQRPPVRLDLHAAAKNNHTPPSSLRRL